MRRLSASIAWSGGNAETSSRPIAFLAVAEIGPVSARITSSFTPDSNIARVRCSIRRNNSSRGTSRPTTTVG